MKKVLFASTALVLTAGVASADIAITGGAKMGLQYDDSRTTNKAFVANEIDFNIVGSGETDGGVTFGASIDLDASTSSADGAIVPTHKNDTTDLDPEVFVSVNGLTLTIGDIAGATDRGGLGDPGYAGIGVDNIAEVVAHGNNDVRVDYAFGDVAVAAAIGGASDDWSIGASASFDSISIDLGVGEATGVDQFNVTVGYSAGAFGAKAYYGEAGSTDGWGVEGSYTSGDVTVTAVYAESGASDAYGIGVAYDLGGATVAGGVGEVAGATKADLGISFSF